MRHRRQNGDNQNEKLGQATQDASVRSQNKNQPMDNSIKKSNNSGFFIENKVDIVSPNHASKTNTTTAPTRKISLLNSNEDGINRRKIRRLARSVESPSEDVDKLDLELLSLLERGFDNKKIAKATEIPLSTIQRRTRLLFKRGLATSRIEHDYAKLGYKKGFLCMRLKGGRIEPLAEELMK